MERESISGFLTGLSSKLAQLDGVEVIAVDSGGDGTAEIVESLGHSCYVVSEKGRARQMNLGAENASGRYFLFLHCDTSLPADVCAWLDSLDTSSDAADAWGFFKVRLSGQRGIFRAIEFGMNLRSRMTSIGTGDQCIFLHRDLWKQVGGFRQIPLMEDVELCKRLRKASRPLIWAGRVVTSTRRWEKHGIVKVVLLMWALRLAFWAGVKPEVLAKYYK